MGVAAGITAGVGAIAQGIMGAKQMSDAKKAMRNFRWSDRSNPYRNMELATKGAEFQREALGTTLSSAIGTLAKGGTRGLLGGIGQVTDVYDKSLRQATVDLDRQDKQRQQLIAQDEVRVQNMMEERERQELAGYGQMYQSGQQNLFAGIGGLAGAAGMLGGVGGAAGSGASNLFNANPNAANASIGYKFGSGGFNF